jgi:DNA-binding transcriptional LysR family regulator
MPHEVAQAAGRIEGRVRLEMISLVVSPELDEAISTFHQRHPAVQIEIGVSPWRSVLERLTSGEAELGIGYDSSEKSGLTYQPLLEEAQQLYCSARHPMFGQASDMAALTAERFVLTGGDEPEHLTRFRRRHALGERVAGVAEDLHEARRLIMAGVAIGFLPTTAAEPESAAGRLWPLLPPDLCPSYPIFLIARADPVRDTATELFLETIRDGIGGA